MRDDNASAVQVLPDNTKITKRNTLPRSMPKSESLIGLEDPNVSELKANLAGVLKKRLPAPFSFEDYMNFVRKVCQISF